LEKDDTDYSDSDSPPPVRKRTPLQRPEEPPADRSGTEQAFREKRSPKPKVIWDPNDGGGRDMRGEKSKKAAKSKGTPNSVKKLKRPAEDPGEEGFSRRAEREALDVPGEGFGVSPPRERRLSKPRVIWDPDDDDDRELLRVMSKSAEPRGPVSPKVHTSPRQYVSPKQASKKANKASAVSMNEREGFREPASEIPNPETLGQKASPLATPMSPGKTRQGLPSVQIDSLRLPTALHPPHTGAYSPHLGTATRGGENSDRSRPLGSPNLAPAMSPGKRKEVLGGGLGSPQGLGVLPVSRSPPGFKVLSGKSRLHNTEQLHVRGDWKGDGTAEGGREFQPMEAQHELASPGKRLSGMEVLVGCCWLRICWLICRCAGGNVDSRKAQHLSLFSTFSSSPNTEMLSLHCDPEWFYLFVCKRSSACEVRSTQSNGLIWSNFHPSCRNLLTILKVF
jgi:hypothetical protein